MAERDRRSEKRGRAFHIPAWRVDLRPIRGSSIFIPFRGLSSGCGRRPVPPVVAIAQSRKPNYLPEASFMMGRIDRRRCAARTHGMVSVPIRIRLGGGRRSLIP